MSKRVRWSIIGFVAIAVVAFAATTAARKGGKPTDVRMENVQKRDLVASVTASGQVRPPGRTERV